MCSSVMPGCVRDNIVGVVRDRFLCLNFLILLLKDVTPAHLCILTDCWNLIIACFFLDCLHFMVRNRFILVNYPSPGHHSYLC